MADRKTQVKDKTSEKSSYISMLSGVEDDGFSPLPDLAGQMTVDIVMDKQKRVSILYEKKLPGFLKWVEFDGTEDGLTLVYLSGRTQKIGMKLPRKIQKHLRDHEQMALLQVSRKKKKITDMSITQLIHTGSIH